MNFINKIKNLSSCERAIICLVLFYLPFHICLSPGYWDDAAFSNLIHKYDYNLITYTIDRYNLWSSRITIELIVPFLTILPSCIWKFLNILMIILLFLDLRWILLNLFKIETNEQDYLLTLLLCAYPFSTMAQTGWIATTTNYLWVVALGLYVINQILKATIRNETISGINLVLTCMAALYCTSYETMAAIIFVISVWSILYLYKKCRKASTVTWCCCSIAFVMLLYIIGCPGNRLRPITDAEIWMPNYFELSFWDKLRMGILSTFMHFVSISSPIFFLLNLVIFLTGMGKSVREKIIASVPMVLDIAWTTYYLANYILGYKTFTYQVPVALPTKTGDKIEQALLLFTVLVWFVVVIYTFIRTFRLETTICGVCVLVLACLPEMAVGITPTVVASILRTTIYLYMAMILLILCIIGECALLKKIWVKRILYLGLMGGCLLNAFQIIRHITLYG